MKYIVVISTVSVLWILFALLLAGCGHDTGGGARRGRRIDLTAAGAWMWEQHDRAVRMRHTATLPASHPLSRTMDRSERPLVRWGGSA